MSLPELLVFARCPEPGKVKTRLIPALGPAGAAALYRTLLRHTLNTAGHWSPRHTEVWCDRPPVGPAAAELLGSCGLPIRVQRGGDLGARMYHAFAAALRRADAALLIGSDCPEIDLGVLQRATALLASHDAVLGPALDGGYVLIGLRRLDARLFEDIPWGSEAVLELTRRRLRLLGWCWQELAPLRDIDRPDDLGYLSTLLPEWHWHGPDQSTDALA